MKKFTTLLCCLLCCTVFAQITISGTVYDEKKKPLLGASVYINNTSIGTSTDNEGYFSLDLEPGNYNLIISFVGLKTESYKLSTRSYKNPLKVYLESNNVLNEIVIRKKLPRSKRKAYLRKFRKLFLGESELGKSCKILNEDAIQFDVEIKEEVFKVTATEPIKILHKSFGYVIHYELAYFKSTPQTLNYFGYTRYDEIDKEGERRDQWLQNRFENYKGTKMHFLRSILRERVWKEGFRVDLVRRIPNPSRPSYEEIKEAEKFLARNSKLQRNPYKSSPSLESEINTAKDILERAKLDSHITNVVKADVDLHVYGYLHQDGRVYLEFPEYLRITYDKIPDKNYKFKKVNPKFMVSMIMLYEKRAFIDEPGVLNKPYDVFQIGYWAFQRIGDALPLNYRHDSEW